MKPIESQTILRQTLERIADMRSHQGPLLSATSSSLNAGLETLPPNAAYSWDGMRRGVNPAHPYVVFQYTLAGWGLYEEQGIARRIMPGEAFAACVPSPHLYCLPPESPGWTYFWVMFNHPHVVARIGQVKASLGCITALAADGLVTARLIRLFEGVYQGGFRDQWAQEQALFEFLWEYERHEHHRRYTPTERERLLADIRSSVVLDLERAPDVACLARMRGMSRSNFSHHFKATTGLSPAQFVTQVRLEEVARLLLDSDATLETISRKTGFADANHLCKVFRRHYHLSPGAFRRQMR